ncbi:MAG: hypothetical protein ACXWP0_01185 [Ktedonobacterales bacterium]
MSVKVRFDEIPHTAECIAHQARVRAVEAGLAAWVRAWPQHCKQCHGCGVVMVDPGDPDVGMAPFFDFCEHCVLAGACPRCGQPHGCALPDEDERDVAVTPFACVACGFANTHDQVSGASIFNAIEGVPDCICEEERYATWQRLNPEPESSPDMSMTEEEVAEYHRTGQVPDSYIQRADRLYTEWRARRTWGR